ncbi:MAG: class D sortase [Thermoanaerobaculia bacterium]
MTRASRWLRRAEITLWVIGISLLGVALGATWRRTDYQSRQVEAFLDRDVSSEQRLPPVETPLHASAVDDPEIEDVVDAGSEPELTEDEMDLEESLLEDDLAADEIREVVRKETTVVPDTRLERAEIATDGAVALIEIPRLRLSAIVREGADEETLELAVGHVPGTALPGEEGNIALAGHRDTFFRPLRRIKMNDRIRVIVPPNTYEYEVTSLDIVEPDEVSVLESSGIEELTLVTCYPFRFIGHAPKRFIVKAERIP